MAAAAAAAATAAAAGQPAGAEALAAAAVVARAWGGELRQAVARLECLQGGRLTGTEPSSQTPQSPERKSGVRNKHQRAE